MANSDLKILIAASIYPPDSGGPATHAKKYYEWFKSQGFKTELVALAHYRKYPRWLRHLLFSTKLFLRALGTNVIYTHDAWGTGFPALLAARLTGNKLIARIGGDMAWERDGKDVGKPLSLYEWYASGLYKRSMFYKLTRIVLKRADKIIVPSKLLLDLYLKYYDVKEDSIEVVSNPVPDLPERDVKTEQTIIFASRLTVYKNLDTVLRVLAKVVPQFPELKFIIMGDGPERKYLEGVTRSLNLTDNVVFTGDILNSDVFEATARALFVIAPALTEFSPNYVFQGMAYQKPFLISRENGMPFDIPEEFIIEPRDETQIEEKVRSLLDKKSYAKAKKIVESLDFKMSWDDVLERNLDISKNL